MYKILIAEDETEMRNLLVKYIKREEPDFEVVGSAVNGKEALEAAERYAPDIVITDIFMPLMNGLEFLKEAGQRQLPMKAIIISGYDEFEYAREAISLGVANYLLKPFDPSELKAVLDKVKKELDCQRILFDNMELLKEQASSGEELLKEQMLRDILLGKTKNLPSQAQQLLHAKASFYAACILKFPLHLAEQEGHKKLDSQESMKEWIEILREGYLHKDISAHGIYLEGQGTVLILCGEAAAKQQFLSKIKGSMEHLKQSLKKYYDIPLICVIGGIYENMEQLKDSYEDAVLACRSMVSMDNRILVCGEETGKEETKSIPDSSKKIKNLKEQILLAVRMGQEKDSMDYLEELMNLYASLSKSQADYVSVSVEELVYAIFDEAEQAKINLDKNRTNKEVQRQMKEKLKHASLVEIKELLKNYLNMCQGSFLHNREKQRAEVIVDHMKELIESNLDLEALNLEWLAERVHFSPTYIRQVFKQKTGERVMEYIIRKRMEKAGKLLLKTNMRVQEVAETCGYSNQRYFASSFKKYYGCTPSDFKENM